MSSLSLSSEPTAEEVLDAVGEVHSVAADAIVCRHAELWRGREDQMRGGFWCPAAALGYGNPSRVLERKLEVACIVLHPDLYAQVEKLVALIDAPESRTAAATPARMPPEDALDAAAQPDDGGETTALVTSSGPAASPSGEADPIRELEVGHYDKQENGPITSWRALAALVGIGEDALSEHRKARPDVPGALKRKPWFPTAEAAQGWYAKLRGQERAQTRRGRPPKVSNW